MSAYNIFMVVLFVVCVGVMIYMRLKLDMYRTITNSADEYDVPPKLIILSIKERYDDETIKQLADEYHKKIAEVENEKPKEMNKIGFDIY